MTNAKDYAAEDAQDGVSVVVPVYNSALTLPRLAEELYRVLSQLGRPFELILVDDGSRDDSWSVARGLAHSHAWIRGISLMRNFGQHSALLCGLRQARYPTTVTIDDDLQNPPSEIPRLLARLNEGFDVVYGCAKQGQHGVFRNLASRLTKIILRNALGAETAGKTSAFRAFRTQLRDAFAHYSNQFVSIDVLLTWGASRYSNIDVRQDPRREGQSNYTAKMLVVHAFNMFTGFSVIPLQVASVLGFIFTGLGVAVLLYVVISYFFIDSHVAGFAFLASIIATFSGVQMFSLGMIGEYLARIHSRAMDRPTYVVQNRVNP